MFLRAVLVGITYFQIIWKMKEDKSLFDRRAKEILSQKWKCLFTVVLRKLLIALLHVFTLLSRMYDTVKTCTFFFFFEIGVSFRIKRVLLFFFMKSCAWLCYKSCQGLEPHSLMLSSFGWCALLFYMPSVLCPVSVCSILFSC